MCMVPSLNESKFAKKAKVAAMAYILTHQLKLGVGLKQLQTETAK